MLKQRIITALVLLAIVATLLMVAKLHLFAGVIAVVTYLLALEWTRLASIHSQIVATLFAVAVTGINLLVWYFAGDFIFWPSPSWPFELVWDKPMILMGLATIACIAAVIIVLGYSKVPKWWANAVIILAFGLILLPAFFISMISIRATAYLQDFYHGGYLVLMMFCLVWAADTGAYFAGKTFGKRKLAPVVSPNKTWEGAIGGFLLSVVIASIAALILKLSVTNWWLYIAVTAGLACLSVYGDLFESALKRNSNIKDSGTLLPGHGGLLDRLDSTIIVAPIYYLSFSYFGWF